MFQTKHSLIYAAMWNEFPIIVEHEEEVEKKNLTAIDTPRLPDIYVREQRKFYAWKWANENRSTALQAVGTLSYTLLFTNEYSNLIAVSVIGVLRRSFVGLVGIGSVWLSRLPPNCVCIKMHSTDAIADNTPFYCIHTPHRFYCCLTNGRRIGGYNLISVFLGAITSRFVQPALIRWLRMFGEKPNNLSVRKFIHKFDMNRHCVLRRSS